MKVQGNNKSNNIHVSYNGETHTLSEWEDITGIKCSTIRARIFKSNWDIKDALTLPVKEGD